MRCTIALVALLAAAPAAAQSPLPRDFDAELRATAQLELAGRAAHRATARATPVAALAAPRSRGPGYALLVAGGAVAVAGLLAEEDLLVVGGVVVAGYGLYLNLR
jgi:hypothetical protein